MEDKFKMAELKWWKGTLLALINIMGNIIDIDDAVANLTSIRLFIDRPEIIDVFVLTLAVVQFVKHWTYATDWKRKNEIYDEENED